MTRHISKDKTRRDTSKHEDKTTQPDIIQAYVLVGEVEATVARHERRELLAVLDQLHAHALPDGGVRLLGLDTAEGRDKKKDKTAWTDETQLQHTVNGVLQTKPRPGEYTLGFKIFITRCSILCGGCYLVYPA